MFIFNGKLDWYSYAVNENITIVVPSGFEINDPICAYWQWTVDSGGNHKANTNLSGKINAATDTTDFETKISFSFGYYSFDAVVSTNAKTLVATMRNPKGDTSKPITLTRQRGDDDLIPSTIVCTGKLNWFSYALNEMITLVIPSGVSDGAPVGLYYQWTVHSDGTHKKNSPVNGVFRNVTTQNNEAKGTFGTGYYTYEVTLPDNRQYATLRMSNPSGDATLTSLQQVFIGLDMAGGED
ncbi:hypothetical protein BKA70DRAFT_1485819 [Coprinopsis sp. MPI-PUGE-AT-0042]|nr:hypothetical protein BKA70DRAFT_1485819 [Coprinopsis sp. MPI-PUGE-AT-0042]